MNPQQQSDRRGALSLTVVSLTLFVIPLTITGSGVLNSQLASEFHTNYSASQWIINAFMVSYSACMALSGAIADGLGRKTTFVAGIVIFTIFSALAAMSPSVLILCMARAGTGIGAAAVTTASTAIIAAEYAGPARARAFTIFGTALGLGLAFGPLIAGLAIDVAGTWRFFYASTAVLLAILSATAFFLPRTDHHQRRSVDWIGSLLFTLALTCIVSALSIAPVTGLWNHFAGMLLLTGLVLALVFVGFETWKSDPVIDTSLFRNREFMALCATAVFLGFGYISLLFYLPQFLLIGGGMSPTEVGKTLVFATVPCLLLPPMVASVRDRLTVRTLVIATFAFLILGSLALLVVIKHPSMTTLALPLLIAGASFGTSLSYIDGAAVSVVDLRRSGAAAGMFNTFRLGGEAVMIPTMGALIASAFPSIDGGRPSAISDLIQGDMTRAIANLDVPREVLAQDFAMALHLTLWVTAGVSALGLLLITRLVRSGEKKACDA